MNLTLLFIGDSLIEFFDWQGRFPHDRVLNWGRSGETAQELEERCATLDADAYSPDFIFIMIGTNNIAMNDYSFLPSYERIIESLHDHWPGAAIIINGLFPLHLPWIAPDTVARLNIELKNLAMQKKCGYLDGCEIFDSGPKDHNHGFLDDGVHLSDYGYALWSDAIEQYLIKKNAPV